ncbi:MAG TPA: hypothetical protein VIT38_07705 [Allosphingosinicella sp.]|jgi:hypothetical protein
MNIYLRLAAQVAFFASVFVAAQPEIRFLVSPHPEDAALWVATVIALFCAVALRLFLHRSDLASRSDTGKARS